jgi:hypothetical protein
VQLLAELRVEAREGLVEEIDPRTAHEGASDRHPLPLAARELARALRQMAREPERFRRFADAPLGLGGGRLSRAEAETHVLRHRHVRVEREPLEDHRDVAILRLEPRHVAAIHRDRSRRRRLESRNQPEQARLAAARRTQDREEGAVVEREVNPVDRPGAVRVGQRERGESQRGQRVTMPRILSGPLSPRGARSDEAFPDSFQRGGQARCRSSPSIVVSSSTNAIGMPHPPRRSTCRSSSVRCSLISGLP